MADPNVFISHLRRRRERLGRPAQTFPRRARGLRVASLQSRPAHPVTFASRGWIRGRWTLTTIPCGTPTTGARPTAAPPGPPKRSSRGRRDSMTTFCRPVSAFPLATISPLPSTVTARRMRSGAKDEITSLPARSGTLTADSVSAHTGIFYEPVASDPWPVARQSGAVLLATDHWPLVQTEDFHAHHGSESVGCAGGRRGHHAARFPVVLADVVCQSLDEVDGLRSERQGQDRRDAEERGSVVCSGVCGQRAICSGAGENHRDRIGSFRFVWDEIRLRYVAGIRDHGPINECTVQPAALEALCDQHRVSTGLLPGDGSDHGGVEA